MKFTARSRNFPPGRGCAHLALRAALAVLLASAGLAQAQTFLTFNVEWFWDELAPHEGAVVSNLDGFPPSTGFVEMKSFAVAQVIQRAAADVVALVEVENEAVVKRIQSYLPGQWSLVFRQGRDSYTGQDVALLTRLPVDAQSISTFPGITGHYQGVTKTPSKLLGVSLQYGEQSIFVIVTHLLSKRNSSPAKDKKRAAQGNTIRRIIDAVQADYNHIVVMGDLNDVPGSVVLAQIRGSHDAGAPVTLVQTAPANEEVYSIKKYRKVIDHILVSPDLADRCGELERIESGPISDHFAMRLVCSDQAQIMSNHIKGMQE